jgi:hypothetical protein
MSKSDQLLCRLDDIIKQKASEKISDAKDKIAATLETVTLEKNALESDVEGRLKQLQSEANQTISNVKQKYDQSPIPGWRQARPDITLLIEITIYALIFLMLYAIWPYLSAANSHIFSEQQYLEALQRPESDYSIDELGKIRIELDSLRRYFDYFDSKPYSPENAGIYDLERGVVFLPIISFIVIYIVPPFVILYIIWFVITYWRYVIDAIWGWFTMMWRFIGKLIECTLSDKWYIRIITGWSPCTVNFGDYFNVWRRQYVDIPIYYEKLKYIQEYYAAKQRYYTIPKRYYIDLPIERYGVQFEYLKRVYVNRAIDVFLQKLIDWYQIYYELPRDELYRYLLGNNQHLAAVWAKMKQTQRQVRGLPYESTTKNGQKCTCPATQTPVKIITSLVSSDLNLAKDDLKTATDKVKNLYDDLSKIRQKHQLKIKPCEIGSQVITNRNRIYFGVLFSIILFFLLLYGYSQIFGTPKWFYSIISPTSKFLTGLNLQPILISNTWDYSLYITIILIMAIIGYLLYLVS